MEHKHRSDLFNVFQSSMDNLSRYESVLCLIKRVIADVRAEENVAFYDVLRNLSNSINNAGWEERHSAQIDIINKAMHEICEKYEERLP